MNDIPIVNVLIVEDNAGDTLLTCLMMQKSKRINFNITHVSSLLECVSNLSDNPSDTDVILLDLLLPDTLYESRKNVIEEVISKSQGIPVIILSGFKDDTIIVNSLVSGASDYIIKDYMTTEVLEHIVWISLKRKEVEKITGPEF